MEPRSPLVFYDTQRRPPSGMWTHESIPWRGWSISGACQSDLFPRKRATKRSCACDCGRGPVSVGTLFFLFLSFFSFLFFFFFFPFLFFSFLFFSFLFFSFLFFSFLFFSFLFFSFVLSFFLSFFLSLSLFLSFLLSFFHSLSFTLIHSHSHSRLKIKILIGKTMFLEGPGEAQGTPGREK